MNNIETTTSEPRDAVKVSSVARLDRIPTGGVHVIWAFILGFAYVVEMFDNTVFSFVAPTIMAEWGMDLAQVGAVISAVFIGMFFGAFIGGRLADWIGRKPVLIWASVFYSLMSLVSAIAPNFTVLFWSRVFTGMGVQAATGMVIVYLSEMFPSATRGRFFSVVTFAGAATVPVTALLARTIAPQGVGAWRWMFVIGSVGILIAIAVAIALPESVRWLSTHNRATKAEGIVASIERRAGARGPLPPVTTTAPVVAAKGTFRDLLQGIYLRRLVVLTVSFFIFIFALYGFQAWLTTILVQRGLTQVEALGIVSIASLGSVVAPLALLPVADRLERRTAILIEGVIGAGALVLFTFSAGSMVFTAIAAFFVYFAIMGATTTWYTFLPEAFPTSIRGIATGTITGIARVAGILQGFLVAAMLKGQGEVFTMYVLAAAFLIMGLVALSGPKATRRSLEDISKG